MTLEQIEVVSFDCFGTLVDWRRALEPLGPGLDFEAWERACRELQAPERPFLAYEALLERSAREVAPNASPEQWRSFARGFGRTPLFADVPAALAQLSELLPLVALSNSDARHQLDLLQQTGVCWSLCVLSEDVRAYKPSPAAWDALVARVCEHFSVSPDRWLHVSGFEDYDLAPARARGLRTAWVRRPGCGEPHGTVDLRAEGLGELARALAAAQGGPFRYVVRAVGKTEEAAARFSRWIREEHAAEVRAAPGVRSAELVRVSALEWRVEYRFARRADFERYERESAPALRARGLASGALEGVTLERHTGEVCARW